MEVNCRLNVPCYPRKKPGTYMVAMGMKYDICSAAMEDPSYIADGGRLTSLTVACRVPQHCCRGGTTAPPCGGGGDTKQ